MKALFLGVDIGTTKVKTVLFDEEGRELKLARRDTNPDCQRDGSAYQDMNLLWDMVAETIREAVQSAGEYGEVKSIGITGQGDGLWLLDKDKSPLGNATLWIDGRAASYIEEWEREKIIRSSGRIAFSGSPLALGAWYYDREPEKMEEARYVVFCKDWIKYCLTGEIVTDASDLSDASLVDVWSRTYSRDLLAKFKMEQLCALLPPIRPSMEIIGTVTKKASEKTALPPGIPVVNGMIDVAATAFGNGIFHGMDSCSIVGTTVYNEMVVNSLDSFHVEESSPSIVCYAEEGKWLMTMGTMLGTPNLDWFTHTFYKGEGCAFSFQEEEAKMEQVGAGAGGIIFHPFLGQGGERAPFVKPSAAGQFFGIKSNHTKEHLLRSVYEGIAYSMKDCYECFPNQPAAVRIAGGGSASEFWCQMFASCLNKTIQVTSGNEIGARGSAILSAIASGYFDNIHQGMEQMIHVTKEFEPKPEENKIYEMNYELYKELYHANWNLWDKRAEVKKIIENLSKC